MSYRVMIVEDSRMMCAQMTEFLADTDYEVVSFCRSGEEALEAYENIVPDLVTMDIVMPGMDGVETATELLRRWPDACLVMVSSMAHDDTIDAVSELGVKGFLCKPFDRESLIESLNQATA